MFDKCAFLFYGDLLLTSGERMIFRIFLALVTLAFDFIGLTAKESRVSITFHFLFNVL